MKPGNFKYVKAQSVEAVIAALKRFEGDARILAGGQSLMPLMNMRMLRPGGIIDANGIPGLDQIAVANGEVRIGALTRYVTLEESETIERHLPLVYHAIRRVADRQVRNRGTLGGSLCHADPAAQMPLCALTLGARMVLVGPEGTRVVDAIDFLQGPYLTTVTDLEMLVEIIYPDCQGTTGALAQQVQRHGDFPTVSVTVSATPNGDKTWSNWRVGACGLAEKAILLSDVMKALEGQILDASLISHAATCIGDDVDPPSDVRASADYRRHLGPIYVQKALQTLLQESSK